MTLHRHSDTATLAGEQRHPSFPIQQQAAGIFLGWGPRI